MNITPTEIWALSRLGYLYYCRELLTEAEAIFQGLATLAPQAPYPWHALGLIARKRNNAQLAGQYFQHVLKLDAAQHETRVALAEVLLEAGHAGEARAVLAPFRDQQGQRGQNAPSEPTMRRARVLMRQWFQG